MKVYLGGPIRDGNNYDILWRYGSGDYFNSHEIEIYNPTADMMYKHGEWIYKDTLKPISEHLMIKKDIANLKSSDILFINWLDIGNYFSIGSFSEFGMAMLLGKVIIVVATDVRIQHHPFITQGATIVVDNLKDGEECVLMYKTLHDFQVAEGISLINSPFMRAS